MQRLNVVGVNTRFGYRTCELLEGDVADLDRSVDVIVVSAFAGDYPSTRGSLIGTLDERFRVNVERLQRRAQFDFRASLGIWISEAVAGAPFVRVLCAEFVGSPIPFSDVLENVFAALSLLEAKQISIRRVALPLLGSGYQGLPAETVARELIQAAKRFLERSPAAESVLFVEVDGKKAGRLAKAMDDVLGRTSTLLPPTQLVKSVRADLAHTFEQAQDLFEADASQLHQDWLVLLRSAAIRTSELGLLGRRLVELLVRRLGGNESGHLHARIRALEKSGVVAPWICGYMHVLRHLGNEAAHDEHSQKHVPPFVEEGDLALSLLCVERLLQCWIQMRQVARG